MSENVFFLGFHMMSTHLALGMSSASSNIISITIKDNSVELKPLLRNDCWKLVHKTIKEPSLSYNDYRL